MAKQMEYTVKITTDGPVPLDEIVDAITENLNARAEVTNWRVKPQPREKKVTS